MYRYLGVRYPFCTNVYVYFSVACSVFLFVVLGLFCTIAAHVLRI